MNPPQTLQSITHDPHHRLSGLIVASVPQQEGARRVQRRFGDAADQQRRGAPKTVWQQEGRPPGGSPFVQKLDAGIVFRMAPNNDFRGGIKAIMAAEFEQPKVPALAFRIEAYQIEDFVRKQLLRQRAALSRAQECYESRIGVPAR